MKDYTYPRTPRQFIRSALKDAKHAERDADLERIGDMLLDALSTHAVAKDTTPNYARYLNTHVWVLRNGDEVIGVGVNPFNALDNVVPNCDHDNLRRMRSVLCETGEDEISHNGYTLTREKLSTPTGQGA